MARIEIHEYDGSYSIVRGTARENAVASLSRNRHVCGLAFTVAVDADTGIDAVIHLTTADPDVIADLLAHDWADVEATRALCWKIILPRLTGAQIQALCLEIAHDAWHQGRDDTRNVLRAGLGLQGCGGLTETVVKAVLTP